MRMPRFAILSMLSLCLICTASAAARMQDMKASAPAEIATSIDALAGQVGEAAREAVQTRVAVAEFSDLHGIVTELSLYLAEELVTALHRQGGLQVLERSLLSKVLREHAPDGILDGSSVQKIGRIIGADAIVVGTVVDRGDLLRVNIRLIAVQSGLIQAAAAADLPRQGGLLRLQSRPVLSGGAGGPKQIPIAYDDRQRGQTALAWAAEAVGLTRIGRLETAHATFSVSTTDGKGSFIDSVVEQYVQYPDRLRSEVRGPFTFTAVRNGERGWLSWPGGGRRMDDDEFARFRPGKKQDLLYLLSDHLVLECVALEPATMGGARCHRVRVDVEEESAIVWIDETTLLPAAFETSVVHPLDTNLCAGRIEYGDYRTAEGLTLPWTSRLIVDGEEVQRLRAEAYEFNVPIAPRLFEND